MEIEERIQAEEATVIRQMLRKSIDRKAKYTFKFLVVFNVILCMTSNNVKFLRWKSE